MSWGIGDRVGVAVGLSNIATFMARRNSPVPSLVLDFAGTNTLDSGITFTRSTTATYVNSSGVITSSAINSPRFDYDPSGLTSLGLIVEESKVNLQTYSQDFSNAAWGKANASIASSIVVAPDGGNFQKLVENTSNSSHAVYKSIVVTPGSTYTHSAYFKAGERTSATLGITDITDYLVIFNLSTGVITATSTGCTGTITLFNNGIYRVTVTRTVTSAAVSSFIGLYNGSTAYTGNGTSGAYIWGDQFELNTQASSYIPTTSAQLTRAADLSPLAVGSWYNTSQGTWFAQVNMLSTAGTPRIVAATPSSKAPILISSQAAAMFDSTTTIATANTITANITQKVASSWSGTTGVVCLNAGTVVSGSQPTGYADLSTIGIGYNSTSNNNFINGRIAKISYYPNALSSSQLQALTGS